eukprot:jgi/Bigna1/60209/fgenesh1_kg.10_\
MGGDELVIYLIYSGVPSFIDRDLARHARMRNRFNFGKALGFDRDPQMRVIETGSDDEDYHDARDTERWSRRGENFTHRLIESTGAWMGSHN